MDKREQLQAKAVDKFLDRFSINPEEPNQWEAIKHPFDRNLLVNAGPGSGKTSVLIARIAYLIRFQHIRPEEILVLAFNRAVVFEIRAKVKEIFGKLGYGAYVRRLDVATFHGYATRNLGRLANETDDWNKDRSTLLRRFADKLDNDPVFRSSISGRIRCLLVDEFQDVNDDIYRIIRALSRQSDRAASVMVIGDDDQDILGWNRSNGESSDFYFRKFIKDYSLPENDILDLKVNFRSGSQIVSHTQDVLSRFFNKHGKDDRRIKQLSLRSATWAEAGSIVTIDYSAKSFVDAIQEVKKSLQEILSSPYQSVAILCRTNNEVAQAYHGLLKACPELIVQNSVSYPVARLRHIGLWLDLVKNDLIIQGDQPLTDNIFERVWSVYQTNDIPEIHNPRDEDLSPRQLWNLCLTEAAYPYLSHLIEFVENLDSDDVIRLLGRDNLNIHPPVVSTIHKVKGLEFDHVFILPSLSSFQIPLNNLDRAFDLAAEEARLQYVAMTRAKKSIVYFSGGRENAWFNTRPFTGNSSIGKILNGAPDEVAISWAWEEMHYNPYPESTLSYIQSKICVRDKLSIAGPGRNIMHKAQTKPLVQVGYLANKVGLGSPSSDLKVSAILRCIYSGKQYFGGRTADSVCKNGWGLVVLLEGILKSDPAANGSKLEDEELTNASASKAIAKNMLNIDEQSLRHHILGSPIIDDAESSDLSHVLDVRKSSNNAAQPLNLVALIYNQHSTVAAVGDIARFNSSGWFAVGLVDATCPMCGREEMHGYRKPYLTKASVLQHYWALVCLKCRKVYEPKSLDDQSIKRLNLYKIPAFKT
jgi:superfamily I DNA/RNA helicase